jgi:hypothetical protein
LVVTIATDKAASVSGERRRLSLGKGSVVMARQLWHPCARRRAGRRLVSLQLRGGPAAIQTLHLPDNPHGRWITRVAR